MSKRNDTARMAALEATNVELRDQLGRQSQLLTRVTEAMGHLANASRALTVQFGEDRSFWRPRRLLSRKALAHLDALSDTVVRLLKKPEPKA